VASKIASVQEGLAALLHTPLGLDALPPKAAWGRLAR